MLLPQRQEPNSGTPSATDRHRPRGPSRRGGNRGDWIFRNLTRLFAVSLLVLLLLIVWEMYTVARPALQEFGWGFLASSDWDPVNNRYGALPFIFGTIVSSLLALVIAGTIALGVAVFLAEMAPRWVRVPLSFLIEILASIPSVIYGLWGIFVLVPFVRVVVFPALNRPFGFLPLFRGPSYGVSLMAAGLVLAIMILPTIISMSRDVMGAVPDNQREAALALGATPWEVTRMAVLPYARSGILGAMILGLGRALGETMAVLMVIGNRPQIVASLFAPAYSMAGVIANEFAEASGDLHLGALVSIGLVLLAISLLLNAGARLLVWSVTRNFQEVK